MANAPRSHPRPSLTRLPEDAPRELLTPHDPAAVPLTAVKNVLLQASFAELREHGLYERYVRNIDPSVLRELQTASLAPGWIPVELAHLHYEACDRMQLGPADFDSLGRGVGNRVQNAVLVSLAKKVHEANYNLWLAVGPLNRMWPRVFQGGSVQSWKIGPRDLLLEEKGYSLNRYEYYRRAHIAALTATYEALGCTATVRITSYNEPRDEMTVCVSWR